MTIDIAQGFICLLQRMQASLFDFKMNREIIFICGVDVCSTADLSARKGMNKTTFINLQSQLRNV